MPVYTYTTPYVDTDHNKVIWNRELIFRIQERRREREREQREREREQREREREQREMMGLSMRDILCPGSLGSLDSLGLLRSRGFLHKRRPDPLGFLHKRSPDLGKIFEEAREILVEIDTEGFEQFLKDLLCFYAALLERLLNATKARVATALEESTALTSGIYMKGAVTHTPRPSTAIAA